MTTIIVTAVVFATPWLYVRAGQRTITAMGIDPHRNRDHPWKVPPAEIALLASGIIGWVAAMGLAFAVTATFDIQPVVLDWMQPPTPTVYLVPIA